MKHMKKNDGYVMVYVLIVFTILSFVAVSICTMAVKNLQAQKATINRMEARYEAEGYLQEFIAKVEILSVEQTAEGYSDETYAKNAAKEKVKYVVYNDDTDGVTSLAHEWLEVQADYDEELITLRAKSKDGSTQIIAEMKSTIEFIEPPLIHSEPRIPTDPAGEQVYRCTYKIKNIQLEYDSYDISYKEVSE